MGKPPPPPPPEVPDDEHRCRRNDGKGWRCRFPRFGGSVFCERHQSYIESRKKKSRDFRPRVSNPRAAPIEPEPEPIEKSLELIKGEEEGVVRVLKLGQIWAFSAEIDGFPRSYARIDHIVPLDSATLVKATPLILHPISDEEISLSNEGLSLACGLFKLSESNLTKKITSFTHKVRIQTEEKGGLFYKIFPKKGEIWAVYKKWDEFNKRFEYKLVEVVSDFSEGDGVDVFGLIRDENKDEIYRRQVHEGYRLMRCFSRAYLPMFSHKVMASRFEEGGELFWKTIHFLN